MGSSKKTHKDKERSKDKKDKSSSRTKGDEVSKKRSSKRRSRSPRSPVGGEGRSPPERSPPSSHGRDRKRKVKDKRRHGEDSEGNHIKRFWNILFK